MIPEVAVLLQRAAARRTILEGLLDSIPATYWVRQSPGDTWSAVHHLRHLATIDDLVLPLVAQAGAGNGGLWLAGSEPGELERQRTAAMESVALASIAELRARMRASREALVSEVGGLPQFTLDRLVQAASAEGAWTARGEWPLRTYLAGWAEHDSVHDQAIRRAMTAPPDLSAVALMRRRA